MFSLVFGILRLLLHEQHFQIKEDAVISDFEVLTGQREGQRFPSHGIALSLGWEAEEGRSKKQRVK